MIKTMRQNKIAILPLLILPLLFSSARGQSEKGLDRRKTPVVIAVGKVGPAVVNISTQKIVKRRKSPFSSFLDHIYGVHGDEYYEQYVAEKSLGSGVIVHPDGYLITNEHVIRRATDITVTLSDKSKYKAEHLSSDVTKDLALLKLTRSEPFTAVVLGRSDDIMVGEPVIAVGNPFGLENSVTTGVISGTNRTMMIQGRETYKNMLQTDALINFGNSGGALLNIQGELIGINTAIQAQGQGIGFALPIDTVKERLCFLSDFRKAMPYNLGLDCATLSYANSPAGTGLQVTAIDKNTPAWNAGVRAGDILYSVNNEKITGLFDFNLAVRKNLGKKLNLSLLRKGKAKGVEVLFPKLPEDTLFLWENWGITVAKVDENIRKATGFEKDTVYRDYSGSYRVGHLGIYIPTLAEGKPASQVGIEAGDVLVSIGDYGVEKETILKIMKEYSTSVQEIRIFRKGRFLTGEIEIP